MKKNLTILFVLFILAGIILLAGFVFPILIKAFLYEPYVKSIVLFVIFAIVVFRGRFTWNNYIMIPIAVVTIIGTFMDSAGNPFFNKPLEWLVSSVGQMQINTSVYNYAPGEYSITDQLRIIKSDGKIMELHTVFLYLYRFFQYLIFYSAVSVLFQPVVKLLSGRQVTLPVKKEELSFEMTEKIEAEKRRRAQALEQRHILPEEVRASVLTLKRNQELIKAIKLVRNHTDLSLGEAKELVEGMEE
ncbi:hypothetical protein [Clostridium sp. HBUAS56010]|uniref:hypothetical protein n=1 Tax=Clostridium sp. HBUAS56010 TaxID=2571127 RepID=UPI00163D7872|nr:hypothetical protein [Clostridium sp. HBUAS56010]